MKPLHAEIADAVLVIVKAHHGRAVMAEIIAALGRGVDADVFERAVRGLVVSQRVKPVILSYSHGVSVPALDVRHLRTETTSGNGTTCSPRQSDVSGAAKGRSRSHEP